jgi:hypothetical protein
VNSSLSACLGTTSDGIPWRSPPRPGGGPAAGPLIHPGARLSDGKVAMGNDRSGGVDSAGFPGVVTRSTTRGQRLFGYQIRPEWLGSSTRVMHSTPRGERTSAGSVGVIMRAAIPSSRFSERFGCGVARRGSGRPAGSRRVSRVDDDAGGDGWDPMATTVAESHIDLGYRRSVSIRNPSAHWRMRSFSGRDI